MPRFVWIPALPFRIRMRTNAAGLRELRAKHYKYKKPSDPGRIFPNLLSAELSIDGPLQCIVSDMTAFCVKGIYC